ncbi:MAG: TetR/AcrR family transcriptional regulator [Steroidobacteraceae bacterium]
MAATPAKPLMVDRILDASLKLFNEQGFHRVAMMRIAIHIGTSPSHIAYHFKSKSDILLALFPRLEAALQEVMELDPSHAVPESIERNRYVLETLWNYRFFFIELPQIAPVDERVFASHLKLEKRILGMMQHSFDLRIEEGTMSPVPPPNSTELLAKTIWITWIDWIRRQQLNHPDQRTPSTISIYEAMLHAYCIVQPYFSQEFVDDILTRIEDRLQVRAVARSKAAPKSRVAGKSRSRRSSRVART